MRLWHYKLLPYLPDAQFKGQLRELVAIMRDWRDKGKTNHLLINKVMEYPKSELNSYFLMYQTNHNSRYDKTCNEKYEKEFDEFANGKFVYPEIVMFNGLFNGWHTKAYLRMNMANLYEKHLYGIGKSRITDEEWNTLLEGYKNITGEVYEI